MFTLHACVALPFQFHIFLIVAKWVYQNVQRHIGPTHLIFSDIRALWHSVLSDRVSECQNSFEKGGLDQYDAEHYEV